MVKIQEQGVSSMDRPFGCMVTALHLDVEINDLTPAYEYVGTNRYGQDLYEDRRFEQYVRGNLSAAMQKAMDGAPFVQPFLVELQGGGRYKVKLVPQLLPLSREYSATVDL